MSQYVHDLLSLSVAALPVSSGSRKNRHRSCRDRDKFLLIREKKAYNPFAASERSKGIAAVCEEFGQVFYVYAMARNPVLAAPMVASYCIVSVILSRIFLKEKLKASQYACVAAVIAGIVLLGISDGLAEA